MTTSILFLAVLALTIPRAIVGQECTSLGSCKKCAQAGCVWAQETKECLSSCPWSPGITCTFGDSSVCKLDLGGTGDDNNDGLNSGAIVGLAIGITLLLLIILLCCCYKKPAPSPPIQVKEDITVMSNPGLGSHNSHKIDVHRCQSANCMECGGKLESPIKFMETLDEEKDAPQNEDMMEDVETIDF
jgi:hypothetical protein